MAHKESTKPIQASREPHKLVVHLKAKKKGGRASKSKDVMPMCTYGAACRRKGCVYRHPPKAKCEPVQKSNRVCAAFLIGSCTFGRKCFNLHPPPEEVEKIVAKYYNTPCIHGQKCRTEYCLFNHDEYSDEDDDDDDGNQELGEIDDVAAFPALPPKPLSVAAKEWSPNFGTSDGMNTEMGSGAQSATSIFQTDQSSAIDAISLVGLHFNHASAGGGTSCGDALNSTSSGKAPIPTIPIPQDIWTDTLTRNPNLFYAFPNALERYEEVNKGFVQNGRDSMIIDLHFQSVKSCQDLLDTKLPQKLGSLAPPTIGTHLGETDTVGVWVLTGSGHHVPGKSHQKQGGVLIDSVRDYLTQRGYKYRLGKDRNHHYGALFVEKRCGVVVGAAW